MHSLVVGVMFRFWKGLLTCAMNPVMTTVIEEKENHTEKRTERFNIEYQYHRRHKQSLHFLEKLGIGLTSMENTSFEMQQLPRTSNSLFTIIRKSQGQKHHSDISVKKHRTNPSSEHSN